MVSITQVLYVEWVDAMQLSYRFLRPDLSAVRARRVSIPAQLQCRYVRWAIDGENAAVECESTGGADGRMRNRFWGATPECNQNARSIIAYAPIERCQQRV